MDPDAADEFPTALDDLCIRLDQTGAKLQLERDATKRTDLESAYLTDLDHLRTIAHYEVYGKYANKLKEYLGVEAV